MHNCLNECGAFLIALQSLSPSAAIGAQGKIITHFRIVAVLTGKPARAYTPFLWACKLRVWQYNHAMLGSKSNGTTEVL